MARTRPPLGETTLTMRCSPGTRAEQSRSIYSRDRTLCFASLTAREFDEEVGTDGLDECLAIAGELDRSLWRALCNDDEIQAAAREARRAIPTDEEIQSSELPGDAWETTAEQLRTGFGRALVLAGTPPR